MDDHTFIILLTILVIIIIIIYLAYVYYSYKNKTSIFAYTQSLNTNQWQPFGIVLNLTPDEIALRKSLVGYSE